LVPKDGAQIPTSGGTGVQQRTQYYPSGLLWVSGSSDEPIFQPYKYNGKEFVETHGYDTYDYGARGYYPAIGRFTTVDPLAEKYYSISPYAYCAGNPVNRIDPTGMFGEALIHTSTHTDENGKVIAVFDDGDLGVYKHKGVGSMAKEEVDKNYSQDNTSAGGIYMGLTEYWDEFINPVTHKPDGRIIFAENFSNDLFETDLWDPLVEMYNNSANNQDLSLTMEDSRLYNDFDLKNTVWAKYGPMTGKLLNGKYATARSAGNYLAGMNGVTGTFQGLHISGTTYMKLAGAYQLKRLTKYNILRILLYGASFAPPPYYGEENYSGRRILQGINAGNKKLRSR
jgi:RHS repeat-associated protein